MGHIFTDQMGRQVTLPAHPPRRIVSLVPSQTELLFDLGLDDEVVGITKFCVHPVEKWRSKPRVGGTKKVDFDKIAALRPDLIIGNKEENERSQIEALAARHPVWMSDITTLDDALDMVKSVGLLVGREQEANLLAENANAAFLPLKTAIRKPLRTAYMIWYRPWMAAAAGTFIHNMMEVAGFHNVFASKTRYPEITLEELSSARPDVVMLSSEPFPFKEKHIMEIQAACPGSTVLLVDGEMFSWYGSRMLLAAPYFVNLHAQISHVVHK